MHGLESVNQLLQARAEAFISGSHIGPQSVATPFGNDVRDKHRARWGSRHKRDVGVPTSVLATLGSVEFENFGMIGMSGNHWVSGSRFAN
jgi:hypothetical protein